MGVASSIPQSCINLRQLSFVLVISCSGPSSVPAPSERRWLLQLKDHPFLFQPVSKILSAGGERWCDLKHLPSASIRHSSQPSPGCWRKLEELWLGSEMFAVCGLIYSLKALQSIRNGRNKKLGTNLGQAEVAGFGREKSCTLNNLDFVSRISEKCFGFSSAVIQVEGRTLRQSQSPEGWKWCLKSSPSLILRRKPHAEQWSGWILGKSSAQKEQ